MSFPFDNSQPSAPVSSGIPAPAAPPAPVTPVSSGIPAPVAPVSSGIPEPVTPVSSGIPEPVTPVSSGIPEPAVPPAPVTPVSSGIPEPATPIDLTQSPIDLTQKTFKPQINNNIVAEITPAKFDGLLKVLNLLTDSNDPIIISKSKIVKNLLSGSIVSMDVKDVFDSDVNLHIVNPKKNIKLFKTLKNNNNIYIVQDDENARYIIMNGEIRLFMPKQDESVEEFKAEMPSLEGVTPLSNTTFDKTTKNIISELAYSTEYIEFLFQNNEMKGIHIPDTAIYIFEKYIKDQQVSKLDETNADLALRSTSFLPIVAENYELSIGKLSDGSYCSYTVCDTGYIKVNIFEQLENTTGGSIF